MHDGTALLKTMAATTVSSALAAPRLGLWGRYAVRTQEWGMVTAQSVKG